MVSVKTQAQMRLEKVGVSQNYVEITYEEEKGKDRTRESVRSHYTACKEFIVENGRLF